MLSLIPCTLGMAGLEYVLEPREGLHNLGAHRPM
jgi:hypothetical protein